MFHILDLIYSNDNSKPEFHILYLSFGNVIHFIIIVFSSFSFHSCGIFFTEIVSNGKKIKPRAKEVDTKAVFKVLKCRDKSHIVIMSI